MPILKLKLKLPVEFLKIKYSLICFLSALDLSEFPSLTNRNTQENSNSNMSHNPMAGRPAYGNIFSCVSMLL